MENIRERRIRDIWFSDKANIAMRKIRQNKCSNCLVAYEAFGNMWDHFDILKNLLGNVKFY